MCISGKVTICTMYAVNAAMYDIFHPIPNIKLLFFFVVFFFLKQVDGNCLTVSSPLMCILLDDKIQTLKNLLMR